MTDANVLRSVKNFSSTCIGGAKKTTLLDTCESKREASVLLL